MDAWNRDRSPRLDDEDFVDDDKDRNGRRREQDAKRRQELHDELDAALDRGLEDTFPASDPVSITQPPHSLRDKYETRRS